MYLCFYLRKWPDGQCRLLTLKTRLAFLWEHSPEMRIIDVKNARSLGLGSSRSRCQDKNLKASGLWVRQGRQGSQINGGCHCGWMGLSPTENLGRKQSTRFGVKPSGRRGGRNYPAAPCLLLLEGCFQGVRGPTTPHAEGQTKSPKAESGLPFQQPSACRAKWRQDMRTHQLWPLSTGTDK